MNKNNSIYLSKEELIDNITLIKDTDRMIISIQEKDFESIACSAKKRLLGVSRGPYVKAIYSNLFFVDKNIALNQYRIYAAEKEIEHLDKLNNEIFIRDSKNYEKYQRMALNKFVEDNKNV